MCKKHVGSETFVDGRGYNRCRQCSSERVARRRKKVKLMAIEYKGGCCEICGYNKCPYALEFHHRNPKEKDFSISRKGQTRAWEKVQVELDKCDLLCSNCHKELHHQLFNEV